MNKEQSNLKQYMEERFRLRVRRRRLYAVVAALSAAVALGVTAELVRPAITVTAPPSAAWKLTFTPAPALKRR